MPDADFSPENKPLFRAKDETNGRSPEARECELTLHDVVLPADGVLAVRAAHVQPSRVGGLGVQVPQAHRASEAQQESSVALRAAPVREHRRLRLGLVSTRGRQGYEERRGPAQSPLMKSMVCISRERPKTAVAQTRQSRVTSECSTATRFQGPHEARATCVDAIREANQDVEGL